MGTITEELFSRRLGRSVHAGDTVIAEVDVAMAHDVTGPLAIEAFRSLDLPLWDATRIVFNFNHVMPANTVAAAELHRVIREFCVEHSITNLFAEGICHQVMVDRRLARPGGIVVGADSHSTTYGGLGCFATGLGSTDIGVVFATGKTWFRIPETIRIEVRGALPQRRLREGPRPARHRADGRRRCRLLRGGMGRRGGRGDERGRAADPVQPEHRLRRQDRDRGARRQSRSPTPAVSPSTCTRSVPATRRRSSSTPNGCDRRSRCTRASTTCTTSTSVSGTPLDEVFIGSCTNGRLSDLAIAASILSGRTVHPTTRTIVVPASRGVYLDALSAGYIEIFARAGALVLNPGCGPCLGRQHHGVVGPGERVLSRRAIATTQVAWAVRMRRSSWRRRRWQPHPP